MDMLYLSACVVMLQLLLKSNSCFIRHDLVSHNISNAFNGTIDDFSENEMSNEHIINIRQRRRCK